MNGIEKTLGKLDDILLVQLLRDFGKLHFGWSRAIIAREPDLGPYEQAAECCARVLLAVLLGREPTADEVSRANGIDAKR
jgi:hypothetical protein